MIITTTGRALRALAVLAATAAVTIGVSACSSAPEEPAVAPTPSAEPAHESGVDVLASHGLEGMSTREVIDALDALPLAERPSDLMASVRPDELLLTDATGTETSLSMPDDSFYVSIAPYLETTHDCYFHSLTTCTGELQGEDVDVVVTDAATGDVIVDEALTTFDNGFVGLWLPRDIEAEIVIEHEGRSSTSTLSTSAEDDATCVTTMQLA